MRRKEFIWITMANPGCQDLSPGWQALSAFLTRKSRKHLPFRRFQTPVTAKKNWRQIENPVLVLKIVCFDATIQNKIRTAWCVQSP